MEEQYCDHNLEHLKIFAISHKLLLFILLYSYYYIHLDEYFTIHTEKDIWKSSGPVSAKSKAVGNSYLLQTLICWLRCQYIQEVSGTKRRCQSHRSGIITYFTSWQGFMLLDCKMNGNNMLQPLDSAIADYS